MVQIQDEDLSLISYALIQAVEAGLIVEQSTPPLMAVAYKVSDTVTGIGVTYDGETPCAHSIEINNKFDAGRGVVAFCDANKNCHLARTVRYYVLEPKASFHASGERPNLRPLGSLADDVVAFLKGGEAPPVV
jgi:hypothetical protein